MPSYRLATLHDAGSVGRLHADSWRRHYRGAYADAYLDGEASDERIAMWTERLGEVDPEHFTVIAETDGVLVGFAHTRLGADPRWGALLDNLHVRHEYKRQGLGRALMAETASILGERRPDSGLYLWVLQQNTAAQSFYRARGGECVEEAIAGPFPGGGTAPSLRYAWRTPTRLFDLDERPRSSDQ